jgi:uncharacterized membrane protein (UPF0127 family)
MNKEFEIRFIADNDAKRTKGLMFAEPLEEDEVVFFIFPHSDYLSFWNKNVSFDLSLAFLNDLGRVVDFCELKAESEKPMASSRPARFVIEAKKGAFDKMGVKIGDMFDYTGKKLKLIPSKSGSKD